MDLIERLRSEAEIADRPGQYDRLNALADEFTAALEAARAERDALLDALRQIAEWPDGGNRYGQEKIKRFAQHTIDAAIDRARGKGVAGGA